MGQFSTLNVTILATKIAQIGQLGLKIWVFPCRKEQIYFRLSISLSKSMFWPPLPCIEHFWSSWDESAHQMWLFWPKKSSRLVNMGWNFGLFHVAEPRFIWSMKKNHIFSPNWPIRMIFLATIVILSVLIHPMMTRNVPGWILEEKTLIYQYILINADKSARCDMKNPYIQLKLTNLDNCLG